MEATPAILQALLNGVTEAHAAWKPAPNRWSVNEVLGHLSHVEQIGFRGRVERILAEENPSLPGYDPDRFNAEGAFTRPSMAEALAEFVKERTATLRVLDTLTPESLARPGVHGELGPLVLADLLHEIPFHDLGHIRQLAELIRAVQFYPNLGPWQKYYQVHP